MLRLAGKEPERARTLAQRAREVFSAEATPRGRERTAEADALLAHAAP